MFFLPFLDYIYFKNYDKMITIDLSKQQAFNAVPKALQQINVTRNLDWWGNVTMFLIIKEEKKKLFWIFSQGTWAA